MGEGGGGERESQRAEFEDYFIFHYSLDQCFSNCIQDHLVGEEINLVSWDQCFFFRDQLKEE